MIGDCGRAACAHGCRPIGGAGEEGTVNRKTRALLAGTSELRGRRLVAKFAADSGFARTCGCSKIHPMTLRNCSIADVEGGMHSFDVPEHNRQSRYRGMR